MLKPWSRQNAQAFLVRAAGQNDRSDRDTDVVQGQVRELRTCTPGLRSDIYFEQGTSWHEPIGSLIAGRAFAFREFNQVVNSS
jgi:hypothetical protein